MENDILKNINNRIFSNPIYFIFGLSWLLVHWRFFVVMSLMSNESVVSKYGITKDIYLKHILFDPAHTLISSAVLLLPFFLTWLVLYLIQPKFLPMLLKKHKNFEDERLKIEKGILKENTNVEKDRERFLNLLKNNREKQQKIKEIDPTVRLQEDYDEFRGSPFFNRFQLIIEAIYERKGNIKTRDMYGNLEFQIPKDLLAYTHTNGIVELNKEADRILLTEKGKYFVKLYSLDTGRS